MTLCFAHGFTVQAQNLGFDTPFRDKVDDPLRNATRIPAKIRQFLAKLGVMVCNGLVIGVNQDHKGYIG